MSVKKLIVLIINSCSFSSRLLEEDNSVEADVGKWVRHLMYVC